MAKKKPATLFDKPKRVRREKPQQPVTVVIPTFAEYADRLEQIVRSFDDIEEIVFNVRYHPELAPAFEDGPDWKPNPRRAADTCDELGRVGVCLIALMTLLRMARPVPLTEADLKRIDEAGDESRRLERAEKWRRQS